MFLGLGLGLTRGGGGSAILVPIISVDFTDLFSEPPVILIDSDSAGTLYWDFHSSATPPAIGAGDIGSGSDTVIADTGQTVEIDLSAYPNETGYLHIRVSNGSVSNVETSSEVTVPDNNILTNGGFDTASDWTLAFTASISGGVLNVPANGDSAQQAVTLDNAAPYEVQATIGGVTGNGITFFCGTTSSSNEDYARTIIGTNGAISFVVWAGTSDFFKIGSANATGTPTVDDVRLVPLAANIVTSPLFDSSTGWSLSGTAGIASSQLSLNATSDSATQTSLGLTSGNTYRVAGRSLLGGSTVSIRLGGNAATGTHQVDIDEGNFDYELVAGSDGDFIVIEDTSHSSLARIRNLYIAEV